jgi:hypothetical protein
MSVNPTINTVGVNLSNTFVRIQKDKISNWYGFNEINGKSEAAAVLSLDNEIGASKNFISGEDIIKYTSDMNFGDKDIITIVIPGLRLKYDSYKSQLSTEKQKLLFDSLSRESPRFEDIFSYDSLKIYDNLDVIHEYQLTGSITPHDVIHIPVTTFLNLYNSNSPILVKLDTTNVVISLMYA